MDTELRLRCQGGNSLRGALTAPLWTLLTLDQVGPDLRTMQCYNTVREVCSEHVAIFPGFMIKVADQDCATSVTAREVAATGSDLLLPNSFVSAMTP